MSKAIAKVLKLAGGVPSAKLKTPPNSCIPSKANIRMNKNSRNNKERMDRIEAIKEITRFRSDDQYFVNLKILKRRNALITEKPNDPSLKCDQITCKRESRDSSVNSAGDSIGIISGLKTMFGCFELD